MLDVIGPHPALMGFLIVNEGQCQCKHSRFYSVGYVMVREASVVRSQRMH